MDNQESSYIAIDISKDGLQVQTPHSSLSEPNTREGFAKILKRTRKLKCRHFVFEATGGYERALLDYLHEEETTVTLVSAARVRAFAASEGIKAKTDPIDAMVIYRFALEKRPAATPPPGPNQRELQALVDRREHLSESLKREKTRSHKRHSQVAESIDKSIRFLKEEIALLEARINELTKSDETIGKAMEVLTSVTGIGPVTAWTIIAHLPEITVFNRSEITALAGLAPYNRDSGKSEGKRCIFGGRSKVRRCLFMAARTATRHNEVIKAYYNKLCDNGKPPKVAMVASMRKLLIHAQSQLKKHEIALA
jgi:transposase